MKVARCCKVELRVKLLIASQSTIDNIECVLFCNFSEYFEAGFEWSKRFQKLEKYDGPVMQALLLFAVKSSSIT